MKKITIYIILSLIFFAKRSIAQTTDDTTASYNGLWAYDDGNLAAIKAGYPQLKGALARAEWDSLEKTPGVFDQNYLNRVLSPVTSNNVFVGLLVYVGPMAPNWIYSTPYSVPKMVTNDNTFAYYPYYLNSTYTTLFNRLIDTVSKMIDLLPNNVRKKLLFYQSCESKTGDPNPYAGTIVSVSINGTNVSNPNSYGISNASWSTYKHPIWTKLNTLYTVKTPKIHLMLNQGNDMSEDPWINSNMPLTWRKGANQGDGFELNDEITAYNTLSVNINTTVNSSSVACATKFRLRGEKEGILYNSGHAQYSPQWHNYWHALFLLHFGLEMWNVSNGAIQDPTISAGFLFFSKYAGEKGPSCSPGAFCAMRDGLDASDFTRFPISTYFNGDMQNYGKRALKIASTYSAYGATQLDTASSNGPTNNQKGAAGINDVGWGIVTTNYERFITQWNPNGTSQGYWQQGPTNQQYGKFARSTVHTSSPSTTKDTMYFDINDGLFVNFPNNAITQVTVNVVYFDNGTDQWQLRYDAVSSRNKLAIQVTKTNTNRWKTTTVVLNDAYFGNRSSHGTDIMLVNNDSGNDMFHMVEVLKGANVVSANFSITPTVVCVGQTVSLTDATTGGAASWNWSMPGGTPSSSALQNTSTSYSASGVYSITLMVNGTSSLTKTISIAANPSVSISGTNTICSGNTITLTASGATSYTWMPGGSTNSVLVNTPTLTTVYTVTGSNGSCSTTKTKTITVTTSPAITIAATSTVICLGNTTTLTASGATSYTWMPGNTNNATLTINPSVTTVYTLTGSAGSCSNMAVKTISVNTLSLSISGSTAVCSGGSTTLIASGANSYTWIPGNIHSVNIAVTPTTATIYTLTGSVGSCTSSLTKTVSVVSNLSLSIAGNTAVCTGGTATLTANGASNYTWMPGGSTLTTINITPSITTTYTLTGSSGSCLGLTTKTISVVPNPTITVSGANTICSGNSVTLTATGASSYTWTPVGSTNAVLIDVPNSTTVYTVTGSNGSCSSIKTKTITVNASPTVAVVATNTILCSGQTEILTASGANTYTWMPGNTNGSTLSVIPGSSATYTVTGSTGTCSDVAVITLSVISNLTVGITGNNSVCSGNSTTLVAIGASNYLWMPGGSTSPILNVSPLSTTIYTLTGSISSCTASASKTLVVNPSPTVSASTSNSLICSGQVVILTANGAPNYTFNPGGITTNPASLSPTITTNYTVTGKSSNGCKTKAYTTVSVTTCTSIEELKNMRPVQVYPNPANDVIHINLKDKINVDEEFLIILIDLTGKEVLRKKYTDTEFKVDVKQFNEGMYILKVIGNQREYLQKVVIQGH